VLQYIQMLVTLVWELSFSLRVFDWSVG